MKQVRWEVEKLGMPLKVARALDILSDLWPYGDGPAHVVHADFNLTDNMIKACISSIDQGDTLSSEGWESDDPIYPATRAVLVWLLNSISENERTAWLENY